MEQTLILNATYEAIKVVDWQRAVTLWFQDKAEILHAHEREVRSPSLTIKVPSVVRLLHYVHMKRRPVVQFTRANIYARDEFTCQYCLIRREPKYLTFDHVVPVAQGGTRGWTNIVTACEPCNRKKADRTPEQAGMTLVRQPRRPIVLAPTMKLSFGWRTPTSWVPYLYGSPAMDVLTE